MKNLAFPFHFDGRGRTAQADQENEHIRQMIEQVLFTSPGERVNRPDFGSGLLQLAFAPNSSELAGALQATLRAALQQWLGDLIEVQDLQVTCKESTLAVQLGYVIRSSQQRQVTRLTREVGGL